MDLQISQFEPGVLGIYKPAGYTPLQALNLLKAQQAELEHTPLTYAGRLDPMAEGLLLVLAGDKVHEKDAYLKFDKTYVVTALLGVETDSFDLLGLCSVPIYGLTNTSVYEHATEILNSYRGKITLPLPLYSSPPHKGKPLFWWAKQKLLGTTETALRDTTIYSITNISMGSVPAMELLDYLRTTIPQVQGDFRQTEIITAWQEQLKNIGALQTISFTVRCSSGTYIRALVQDLGQKLGTGACVYKLIRTHVGPFDIP